MRKKKLQYLFLIFFAGAFFALAKEAQAAIYYVDGNLSADCASGNYSIANRACNGSNGNAYNTITDVNSRLQAGDTAYIRAGTYVQQINPTNNGTSEVLRITYSAYPGETVNVTYTGDQAYLYNKDYITISGLNFKSPGPSNNWINALSSSHVTILKCTFAGVTAYSGVALSKYDENASTYIILANNIFYDSNSPKEWGPGDSASVNVCRYCLVENNTFNRVGHCSLAVRGSGYCVIRNNIFNNTWHTEFDISQNEAKEPILVEGNIFKNTGSDFLNQPELASRDAIEYQPAIQSGPDDSGTHNSILRNNLFYNNGKSIAFFSDRTYGGYDWWINQDCTNNKFYNNTIDIAYDVSWAVTEYDDNPMLIGIGLSSADLPLINNWFKNNCVYSGNIDTNMHIENSTDWTSSNVNYFINNDFYGSGTSKYKGVYASADKIGNTFNGKWDDEFDGNINVDPAFTNRLANDYTLQPSSPLIDAGTWLTTVTSASGNGASFTVADAGYFCDGWGIVTGDVIKLQNGQERTITAINYATNQITVNSSVSWTQGMGVALDFEGAKPDIGAKEFGGGGTDTQAPGSPSGLSVR